jgi:uncharacterized protein (UPF0332 family)
MSICPNEIFAVAESLSQSAIAENSEACRRSSASRAYYAAMHAAMAIIPNDLTPSEAELKGMDSHKAVSDALTRWAGQVRNGRSQARFMARKLPKLKQTRKHADYKLGVGFAAEVLIEALKDAAEIMEAAAEAERKCAIVAADSQG